jgi:hypothetical protein
MDGLLLQFLHLLLEDVVGAGLGVEGCYLTLQLVDNEVFLGALLPGLMELLSEKLWS